MDTTSNAEVPGPHVDRMPQGASVPHRSFAIWLLDFCQTDFPTTKGTEREKWCKEFRDFIWNLCEGEKKPISVRYIEGKWRTLHRKLGILRQGQPWHTNVSARLILRREGNTVKGEAQFKDLEIALIEDLAVIALSEVAGLLAICANESCEQFFIRERRQVYCSLRCRDTVNKRAYRKRRK